MHPNIHIAIADDHPLILNGLKNMLRYCPDMTVVGTYPGGRALLQGLLQVKPDVLLLDIQMPDQSGEEVARIISGRYPEIKMLALTNLDHVHSIKSMLQQGVLGYVLKTASETILLQAIRTVYRGEQFLEPELKEKVLQHALSTKQQQGALDAVLTRREKQVLQLIASDHTSQEIAEKLCVSKRTVDNHRIGLLLKLGVKSSPSLVKKAIDLGLLQ